MVPAKHDRTSLRLAGRQLDCGPANERCPANDRVFWMHCAFLVVNGLRCGCVLLASVVYVALRQDSHFRQAKGGQSKTLPVITKDETSPGLQITSLPWVPCLVLCLLGLTLVFSWLRPGPSQGLEPFLLIAFWAAHIGVPLCLLVLIQVQLGRLRSLSRLPEVVQIFSVGL